MNHIPDIIGYKLEDALAILNQHDFEIIINETFGKVNQKTPEARVIRQRNYNNIIQLTIAYF